MKKIFLYGAHAHRIPLAYSAYRKLAESEYNYVSDPFRAEILLFGFVKNMKDNPDFISSIIEKRPDIKLVVLSEEPLWDTLWSGDYLTKHRTVEIGSETVKFEYLNHFTTDIFAFGRFPYYITTCDDYFVRYAYLFRRNAKLSASQIRAVWQNAIISLAYYAEKRTGIQFDMENDERNLKGLCSFRTDLAQAAGNDRVIRVGKGWDVHTVRRQALPDWHLDKLATLDKNAFIVSGLENTHFSNYISEKIFDAFAVLGVPLYFASPDHSVFRIVPEDSFINLYGLTLEEAADKVRSFKPDSTFMENYQEAQAKLAALFSRPSDYCVERRRILNCIRHELSA